MCIRKDDFLNICLHNPRVCISIGVDVVSDATDVLGRGGTETFSQMLIDNVVELLPNKCMQ